MAKLAIDPQAEPGYTLRNGILRFHDKIVIGENTELREQIITAFHNIALGGHFGEQATYRRVKLVFHWRGLKGEVIDFVKKCATCQKNFYHCIMARITEGSGYQDEHEQSKLS
jgi:hypothetical protein